MSQPEYKKGIDYRFNGVVPHLPLNTKVELIYFCDTRQEVILTKCNMTLWYPRPMHDPQIKAFCIIDENYQDEEMTDHTTNHAEEQAAKTEALLNSCAEYLFNKFDWELRTSEVEEVLSVDFKALAAAHARVMRGYGLDLQLLFNSAAMGLCEESANRIVAAHGDDWLVFLEGVDYE